MQEFYYRYKSTLDINNTPTKKGMLTAILELGAMVGAIMAGPIADRWSRKYSISGWCVLFIIGTIIQVAANRHVACIYAGRWFAGMAVGALSMLVPMWNAEVASPGIRGALVALQQLAITFGILVSYWIGAPFLELADASVRHQLRGPPLRFAGADGRSGAPATTPPRARARARPHGASPWPSSLCRASSCASARASSHSPRVGSCLKAANRSASTSCATCATGPPMTRPSTLNTSRCRPR